MPREHPSRSRPCSPSGPPSVSEYLGRNASPTSDGSFDIRPVLRVESDVFGLFPLRIACVFESHTRCLSGDRGERVGVSVDSAHSPAVEANTGSVLRMVESLGRAPDPNISDIPTPPTGVSRTVLRLLQVRRNRAPSDSGLERFAHQLRIITTHCVEEELDDFCFCCSTYLLSPYFLVFMHFSSDYGSKLIYCRIVWNANR